MPRSRPRLLDLFCKAGGASMGYHRAGFDVTGVDHEEQPRYPFPFVLADALEYVREHGREYDVIHASPPCQRYSQASRITGNPERHPDLVEPVRQALAASGRLWVIENVPGAPLYFSALVCGLALGCGVKRHRLFESNVFLFGTTCPPGHRGDFISVFGPGSAQRVGGKGWVSVHGGGAPAKADRRRRADAELARRALGIDWMTRDELSQAIPPPYTEFIGKQLFAASEEDTTRAPATDPA
jgi:DNA (cytosine-5)-methyltransferase 1